MKLCTGITNLLLIFDVVSPGVNFCLAHVGISVLYGSHRLPLLNGKFSAQLNVLAQCTCNPTVVFCRKLLLVNVVDVLNGCLSRADAADLKLEVKRNWSMKLKIAFLHEVNKTQWNWKAHLFAFLFASVASETSNGVLFVMNTITTLVHDALKNCDLSSPNTG